uniref:Uncharacterized protein n=1 Tax=Anguilla anguilla TaxID=7936 RepID=A0A0E9XHE8_ANGAN
MVKWVMLMSVLFFMYCNLYIYPLMVCSFPMFHFLLTRKEKQYCGSAGPLSLQHGALKMDCSSNMIVTIKK